MTKTEEQSLQNFLANIPWAGTLIGGTRSPKLDVGGWYGYAQEIKVKDKGRWGTVVWFPFVGEQELVHDKD